MYPGSSKLAIRSKSGVDSHSPEKLAEESTPNAFSGAATASSGVESISVYLRFGKEDKLMIGQSVESMQQFFQAGKALLGIPANENVEFMVNGKFASGLSLDEFARMVPLVPRIFVVPKFPKTSNPGFQPKVTSPAPEKSVSPPSLSALNSPAPQKLVQGITPNLVPRTVTGSSGVESISAFLQFGTQDKSMNGQSVESMEQFFQAGKALFDIPADENVEFIINGKFASGLSLDEFSRMVRLVPRIFVVSKSPKKD